MKTISGFDDLNTKEHQQLKACAETFAEQYPEGQDGIHVEIEDDGRGVVMYFDEAPGNRIARIKETPKIRAIRRQTEVRPEDV